MILVINGKTVRGTINPEDPFGLHLPAAHLPERELVLLQIVVENEKRERNHGRVQTLGQLDLRNNGVMVDCRAHSLKIP
jgi:hypothetical protein